MAAKAGDILAAQIGTLSIERANAMARAMAAEAEMEKLKAELDALKQSAVTPATERQES